jgi:AcrR family transcriptional regulator
MEGSARERLLAAANELFYEEGIHTVGIDRVIERAGVAKASLYSTFGSKDELVRAYLAARAQLRRQRIVEYLVTIRDPREKVLAVFHEAVELVARPTFRGCAFINATAEGPRDGAPLDVCRDQRAWLRDVFTDLLRELRVPSPQELALQLVLLYDGALVAASRDRDLRAPVRARQAAEVLLDAALAKASAAPKKARR